MSDDPRARLEGVPDLDDAPIDWDPAARRFRDDGSRAVRADAGDARADDRGDGDAPAATRRPLVDDRRMRIAAPPEGGALTPPPRRAPVVVAPDEPTTTPGPGPERVVVPPPATGASAARSAPPQTPPVGPTPARGWWPPGRRTVLRGLLGLSIALLVLGILGLLFGYQRFNSIETVDLSAVLASGDGTNYLIVGSDTREGVDADDPNAGAIIGDDTVGGPERSDTILILRIDGAGARMLSVPRDLLVTIAETGERTRINAAFNGGPTRLVATLDQALDLPVHHYLEIDFVSFRDLVDALGGIVIDFPHPAFDTHSGLVVPEAGPVRLDGDMALAYVRSRFYTEIIDGREVPEGTGDIGRVMRQQAFLAAVVDEIGAVRNPLRLASITNALVDGMRIDDELGYLEAIGLVWRFRSLDPTPNSLPTSNLRLSSGAQVLELVQPGADEVLADFGSGGATG